MRLRENIKGYRTHLNTLNATRKLLLPSFVVSYKCSLQCFWLEINGQQVFLVEGWWNKRHEVKVCMHTKSCYWGVKRCKHQGRWCCEHSVFPQCQSDFTITLHILGLHLSPQTACHERGILIPKQQKLSVISKTTHMRVQKNNSYQLFQICRMRFSLVDNYNYLVKVRERMV